MGSIAYLGYIDVDDISYVTYVGDNVWDECVGDKMLLNDWWCWWPTHYIEKHQHNEKVANTMILFKISFIFTQIHFFFAEFKNPKNPGIQPSHHKGTNITKLIHNLLVSCHFMNHCHEYFLQSFSLEVFWNKSLIGLVLFIEQLVI